MLVSPRLPMALTSRDDQVKDFVPSRANFKMKRHRAPAFFEHNLLGKRSSKKALQSTNGQGNFKPLRSRCAQRGGGG
jgi:hypothetical protein